MFLAAVKIYFFLTNHENLLPFYLTGQSQQLLEFILGFIKLYQSAGEYLYICFYTASIEKLTYYSSFTAGRWYSQALFLLV
jgi:hypothetical protein